MTTQKLHPRTAIENQKDKNLCRRERLRALNWLAEKFPEAFNNEKRIRPFKKGIMEDLMACAEEAALAGISRSKLREALVVFTRRVDYLTCLKARETRVDLAGNPCGEVTDEEAERAATKIRKRVEKSARNARKALAEKTASQARTEKRAPYTPAYRAGNTNQYTRAPQSNAIEAPPAASYYPDRVPAYSSHNPTPPKNSTPVIVKHKPARRPYDPKAVDRLKAKLDLNRNSEKATAE